MTVSTHILVIAVIEIMTACGITLFWFSWFRSEHEEPWLPDGFNEHERVFVYPDLTMSFLMGISAILLLKGFPAGKSLSLVCAGMMLFLAVIDTAYFIQHGMFSKKKERVVSFQHCGAVFCHQLFYWNNVLVVGGFQMIATPNLSQTCSKTS